MSVTQNEVRRFVGVLIQLLRLSYVYTAKRIPIWWILLIPLTIFVLLVSVIQISTAATAIEVVVNIIGVCYGFAVLFICTFCIFDDFIQSFQWYRKQFLKKVKRSNETKV